MVNIRRIPRLRASPRHGGAGGFILNYYPGGCRPNLMVD